MGGISIAWYAALTLLSKDVLNDSILALGLCIAFYYALTGFACPIVYRRLLLHSVRNFVLMGAIPIAGALSMVMLFAMSCLSLSKAGATAIFGISAPLAIGIGSLALGVVPMLLAQYSAPAFFRRKPEPAGAVVRPSETA
jgi:hypothetical protein